MLENQRHTEVETLLSQANRWQADDEYCVQVFQYGNTSVSINLRTAEARASDPKSEYEQFIESLVRILSMLNTKKQDLHELSAAYETFANPQDGKLHSPGTAPYSRAWQLLDCCCSIVIDGSFITLSTGAAIAIAIILVILVPVSLGMQFSDEECYPFLTDLAIALSWSIVALLIILGLWATCNWMGNDYVCCAEEGTKLCNASPCCKNITPHQDVTIAGNPNHWITRQYNNKCQRFKDSMQDITDELKRYEAGKKGAIGLIASITSDYAHAIGNAPQ